MIETIIAILKYPTKRYIYNIEVSKKLFQMM